MVDWRCELQIDLIILRVRVELPVANKYFFTFSTPSSFAFDSFFFLLRRYPVFILSFSVYRSATLLLSCMFQFFTFFVSSLHSFCFRSFFPSLLLLFLLLLLCFCLFAPHLRFAISPTPKLLGIYDLLAGELLTWWTAHRFLLLENSHNY